MTTKEAYRLVLRSAELQASGNVQCTTIMRAVHHVEQVSKYVKQPKPNGLTLTRTQADNLLSVLAVASKGLDAVWPSTAQRVRDIYADLAERYAAAGFDVAELNQVAQSRTMVCNQCQEGNKANCECEK